jgi:ppGpp synthetase/RelA/SpoT-type nucleotidyltranferase
VPLPISRNQIKKLGTRLAASSEISAADDQMLEDLIACHLDILDRGRPRLEGLNEAAGVGPLHIGHRPKTTATIIDKLRRHGDSMPLHSMQDLAGFRVVGVFSFMKQDDLVAEICRRFPADPREPRIRDRRAEPSYGYRAVHVIVSLDDITIEIQVRTLGQHLWADLMERIADRLGRGIRYGEPPVPPPGTSPRTAQLIVNVMTEMSDDWAVDEPSFPPEAVHRLEEFTEEIWVRFSRALAGQGIDL